MGWQDNLVEMFKDRADSPIESLMWLGFETVILYTGDGMYQVQQQVEVLGRRVDFLVRNMKNENLWCIVECDGHDFHERTKEQAARDRSFDRTAQAEGYLIFRFTGSEIWNDPFQCAIDVCAALHQSAKKEAAA